MNTIYIFNSFINARERGQCQEGGMSNCGITNVGTQSNFVSQGNGKSIQKYFN